MIHDLRDDTDDPGVPTSTVLLTDGGSEAEQETTEKGEEPEESGESQTDEAAADEPATVEADDEAVVEQTGDVGVEPETEPEVETEETGAEPSGEEAEPSLDGEGDTAGILEIRNQVRELSTGVIGRSLDGIIEISRSDGIWRAVVEVIERRSVPDTQDILGQYEIELDENGEVIGYRRLEKYRRSDTGPSQR